MQGAQQRQAAQLSNGVGWWPVPAAAEVRAEEYSSNIRHTVYVVVESLLAASLAILIVLACLELRGRRPVRGAHDLRAMLRYLRS
jgi:hypothetical protein